MNAEWVVKTLRDRHGEDTAPTLLVIWRREHGLPDRAKAWDTGGTISQMRALLKRMEREHILISKRYDMGRGSPIRWRLAPELVQ